MSQRRPFETTCRLAVLTAALLALSFQASWAQAPPPAIDHVAQNAQPKFFVRVSVDKEYRIYNEGEALKLNVRCEEDAYLYVLYQQADGNIFQIFPNSGQPDNRIKGKQDIHVPDLDDAFRWVIAPPLGHEVVKVIASKKPVDVLSLPGLKENRFNPVTNEQVDGAAKQLAKEPAKDWTEDDLEIQTVPKGAPTTPPEAHKRYGVFFGVSKYEFNDVRVAAYGPKGKMNLTLPENDAEDTSQLLRQTGRLTDTHTFKNEQVTKERMKKEITEWLPSVSKPGDTVFIYFSGHGAQIADDDQDEADKKDEVLMTHETVRIDVWVALQKLHKEGNLAPQWAQLMARLGPELNSVIDHTYNAAGGDANKEEANRQAIEQADGFLVRSTAVGDDEMGHWMQKLDGRHVVVVTDACRSGGLANAAASGTKGLSTPARARPAEFQFLRKNLLRLKDLNQPSLTLLAAASEEQDSLENKRDRNGWFTMYLLERLNASPGPVDTRQAWEHCRDRIAKKFVALNAALAAEGEPPKPIFEPQLVSTELTPIVLKPAQ